MTHATERPWQGRAVLHVDMDAFFASVEQLDHPEWRGKPVIVGGDPTRRGVVSTCSYEARVFGVHSAMPSAQAARLCPDAIWVSSNFGRYGEMSRAVREILSATTPDVEPTSIDEAYLDVTPGSTGEHPVSIARRIQQQVDELGVSCSIGVASCKTVAKIASDHLKPHGITVVWPGEEAAFLAPLRVGVLPGVGKSMSDRLARIGIRRLGELADMDDATAREVLGRFGPDLTARARGIDARRVHYERDPKSVSNEHTFSIDVRERDEVERALAGLVAHVAARLRKARLSARTLTVKLRYADFSTPSVQRTIDVATDLEDEMLPVALSLLRSAWSPGAGLRLIGFGTSGFEEAAVQLDLFASSEQDDARPQRKALAEGLDAVKQRFGENAIRRGIDISREKNGPDTQPL
ncbi:MAG: DNA polymerase IV [Actinobacteria bacterium]|nr:MAG: DNA polymerase IV [Actinomycetota bacterium]